MKLAMQSISYEPIGVIRTPFVEPKNMPIQPAGAQGVKGSVEIRSGLEEGLQDLAGFSHVFLLYHFDRVSETRLTVVPFLDSQPRGVFSTRAPVRPNSIGLSVVRLVGIDGLTLHVENVDMLDGTPLLDIKPYVPDFDVHPADRVGWLAEAAKRVDDQRSDGRFT